MHLEVEVSSPGEPDSISAETIVIPCLLFSLLESLNILPAHLSSMPTRVRKGPWQWFQSLLATRLRWLVLRVYCPFLETALRWRYVTASSGVGVLIVTAGMVVSGRPTLEFLPSVEAEFMSVSSARCTAYSAGTREVKWRRSVRNR